MASLSVSWAIIPEKKPLCNAFPCPRGIDRSPETCYCSIQKRLRRRHVPAPAAHNRERLIWCKSLCGARPDTASEPRRGNVRFQNVTEDNFQIFVARHRLGQHGLERPVDLDRDDLFRVPAQLLRQRPDAGADLQYAARLVHAGFQHDVLRHPALRQEILPLGLGKMESVPREQRLDLVDITKVHR